MPTYCQHPTTLTSRLADSPFLLGCHHSPEACIVTWFAALLGASGIWCGICTQQSLLPQWLLRLQGQPARPTTKPYLKQTSQLWVMLYKHPKFTTLKVHNTQSSQHAKWRTVMQWVQLYPKIMFWYCQHCPNVVPQVRGNAQGLGQPKHKPNHSGYILHNCTKQWHVNISLCKGITVVAIVAGLHNTWIAFCTADSSVFITVVQIALGGALNPIALGKGSEARRALAHTKCCGIWVPSICSICLYQQHALATVRFVCNLYPYASATQWQWWEAILPSLFVNCQICNAKRWSKCLQRLQNYIKQYMGSWWWFHKLPVRTLTEYTSAD